MHSIASLSEDKSSKFGFESLFEIETPPPRAPPGLEEWKPMYDGIKLSMIGLSMIQVSDKQITSCFDKRVSKYEQNTLPYRYN